MDEPDKTADAIQAMLDGMLADAIIGKDIAKHIELLDYMIYLHEEIIKKAIDGGLEPKGAIIIKKHLEASRDNLIEQSKNQ